MNFVASVLNLLFEALAAASTLLKNLVNGSGLPFSFFLGTILILLLITIIFKAFRSKALGGLMSSGKADRGDQQRRKEVKQ